MLLEQLVAGEHQHVDRHVAGPVDQVIQEVEQRLIGVVGVLWPSKRFADAELVPGGAAGIGDADPALADDLRAMAGAFDAPGAEKVLARAATLAGRLEAWRKDQTDGVAERPE